MKFVRLSHLPSDWLSVQISRMVTMLIIFYFSASMDRKTDKTESSTIFLSELV